MTGMIRESVAQSLAPHREAVVDLLRLIKEQSLGHSHGLEYSLELFLVKCSTTRMQVWIGDRPRGATDTAAARVSSPVSLCDLLYDVVQNVRSWDDVQAVIDMFADSGRADRDAMLVRVPCTGAAVSPAVVREV